MKMLLTLEEVSTLTKNKYKEHNKKIKIGDEKL